jgi:hypothetical protein
MIDVTFEIGGRKVSPNRLGDELEKAILSEVAANVKKALGSVTCPEHGQRPKVIVKGRDIKNLPWEVTGCCQKLVETAMKRLK